MAVKSGRCQRNGGEERSEMKIGRALSLYCTKERREKTNCRSKQRWI